MNTKTDKDWQYNEQIALIADSILSSYDDWNYENITDYVARFETDIFSDSGEQDELVQDIYDYLRTYGDDLQKAQREASAVDQILEIRDNEGKTLDRYSVVLTESRIDAQGNTLHTCLGLSHNATAFSQFCEAIPGEHLGKLVDFYDLPENLQSHIIERLS